MLLQLRTSDILQQKTIKQTFLAWKEADIIKEEMSSILKRRQKRKDDKENTSV